MIIIHPTHAAVICLSVFYQLRKGVGLICNSILQKLASILLDSQPICISAAGTGTVSALELRLSTLGHGNGHVALVYTSKYLFDMCACAMHCINSLSG